MDYKLYDMGNYNLYLINTDKFKTISLSAYFRHENTREDVVYLSILKDVLEAGTAGFEKLNDYYRQRLEIYDPKVTIRALNYGKDRTFLINGQFANENYTEQGMNEKSIKFIFDMLYNPKLDGEAFDAETFEICRHDYVEALKSAKDNPTTYSQSRLWEEMDVYDYDIIRNDEAIDLALKMTAHDLYKYYQTLFTKNSLDIFVIGNFDNEKMKEIIASSVKGDFKQGHKNRYISYESAREEIKEVIEPAQTGQSQLAIGLKFTDLTDFERKYVSVFYISILGGNWSSKLNQVVREDNSLCYYIGAIRNIPYSVAFIYAGIDAEDFKKTCALIKEQMESMIKGDFTLDAMKQVKQIYENSLVEIEDSQMAILNTLTSELLSDNDDIDKRRELIGKVTKEDIINLSKKVHFDVIYLLKGENNGKDQA